MLPTVSVGHRGLEAMVATPKQIPATAPRPSAAAAGAGCRRQSRQLAIPPSPMAANGAVAAAIETAPAVIWGKSGSNAMGSCPLGPATGLRCEPWARGLLPQCGSAGKRYARAVALLLLVATGLSGAMSARAADPPQTPRAVRLLWTAPTGGTFSVDVPPNDLEAFLDTREGALEAEQARLAAIGSGTLASEIGGTATELMIRVPAYVDWVYDWIDGYIAAFRVLGRGGHAWFTSETPRTAALVPSITEAMHEVSAEQLAKLVVDPVDPATRLQRASFRVDRILTDEWRRVLARDQTRWLDFLRVHAGTAKSVAAGGEGTSVGCMAEAPAREPLRFDVARLTAAPAT